MGTMVILGATTYESLPCSVGAARRYVRGLLDDQGIECDDLPLITSELVTNAITHGGGSRIALTLGMDDSALRLEVSDSGAGNPRLRPESLNSENGRGLTLVAALAETWGITRAPTRTTVWAELPRK